MRSLIFKDIIETIMLIYIIFPFVILYALLALKIPLRFTDFSDVSFLYLTYIFSLAAVNTFSVFWDFSVSVIICTSNFISGSVCVAILYTSGICIIISFHHFKKWFSMILLKNIFYAINLGFFSFIYIFFKKNRLSTLSQNSCIFLLCVCFLMYHIL